MVVVTPHRDVIAAADRVPLRVKLRRAERMRTIRAMLLVAPLFLFLILSFVTPIGAMLLNSIKNPEMSETLPRAAIEFQRWDGEGLPDQALLAVFAADVREAQAARTIGRVGKRLNYDITGFRSLLLKTARNMPPPDTPNLIDELIKIDKRWGEPRYWLAIKKASPSFTLFYLLAALDMTIDAGGDLVEAPPEIAIYLDVLARTFWISLVVTMACFVLGYPIAYLLATLPTRMSNLLMVLVLLPFWTSLLVRTTAWLVLLQSEGLVNNAAMALGLWSERIQLVHNRTGVYVAMVHILLPFMVLPLYSVMKGISPTHMRAAASLGATPFRAFFEVYVPQTVPGIGAGVLLVFIISLGYYITPALVGGPKDQMLSYFVAFHTNQTLNWGMAAALSVVLLVCVLIFFAIYNRLVGIDRMRLG